MIQKCRVDGNVSGSSMVGGIIGSNNISNNGSKISLINFSGCSFSGNVSGCCDVGGVIGSNNITGLSTITIMSCSASGVVKGSDSNVSDVGDGNSRVSSNVGGFIGSNTCMDKGDCHISGNYATSDVFGNKSVGGLIGCNNQSGDGEIPILICYAAGCVRGFDFVGGLVGSNTLNGESDEGVIAISNCVALNPVVKAEGENINRIVGMNNGGELESNYAIKSMVNNANIFLIYDSMGEYGDDLDPKEAESEEFYKKKLSWFFDLAWKMLDSSVSTYRYPVLKADTDAPISLAPITELPSTTGRYILDSDIELDSTWNAPQDFVSIDLNGHKISLKSGVSGSVINVENDAILSIQDSSADKSGAFTGGNTDGNGGGVYIHNGILVMLGGSISNNSANCGGGVYIEVDPVDYEDYDDDIWISPTWWENFAFFGGNVTNNTAKQNGGGVYASENADFLLSGGSVDNNVAENRGGGVCVNTSSFVAYNGEITKNTAKSGGGVATVGYQFIMISDVVIKGNKAVCGGGIDLGSDLRVFDSGDNEFEDMDELNSIMMFNGTIIENEAEIGGGIYLYCGEIDYFNGIVKDNIIRKQGDGGARGYDGVQSNVYICSNSIIAVDNEISNSSCVGVTTEIEPTAGNPVEFAYIPYYDEDEWEDEGSLSDELTTSVDYTRHFFSDKSEYHVEKDDWDVFYLVKTMPIVPDLPTPTKDASGNVTILVEEGGHINATIDETDSRKVTIQDTNSGVNLTIIFNEPQSNLSDFNGTVDEGNVFAQYNESDAIFAYGMATAKYQLNITLKDVTNLLPTISPEIKPEVKNEVIKSGMELAVMISATSNVSEINSNMTSDGLTITFTVPESWYNSMKGGVYSIHMKDGVLTKKLVTGETDGSGNVIITVKGDSFSSYGIAGFSEKPEPTPVPPAPSGGSSGSSTWLTPTPVSTVTPTATPTDVAPTTQPTSSQPTKPAGTPVPIAGLILGGLAAAAVLRRK